MAGQPTIKAVDRQTDRTNDLPEDRQKTDRNWANFIVIGLQTCFLTAEALETTTYFTRGSQK